MHAKARGINAGLLPLFYYVGNDFISVQLGQRSRKIKITSDLISILTLRRKLNFYCLFKTMEGVLIH